MLDCEPHRLLQCFPALSGVICFRSDCAGRQWCPWPGENPTPAFTHFTPLACHL